MHLEHFENLILNSNNIFQTKYTYRNIFLNNEETHVIIGDFGISRPLYSVTTSFISTFCGTPLYMSPELKAEFLSNGLVKAKYSFNTDVW